MGLGIAIDRVVTSIPRLSSADHDFECRYRFRPRYRKFFAPGPRRAVHPAAAKVTGVILLFAKNADIYFHCNR